MLGIANGILQPAAVGEHNQTFTGVVEPAGRVNTGQLEIISERRATFFVREFAKNVIRFVEQDQTCHKVSKSSLCIIERSRRVHFLA